MPRRRVERLNEQLKREISGIVRADVQDPRIGPVTITGVEVTGDLSLARVYVRALGGDEALESAMEGLEAASPHIRRILGQDLHLRRIPELEFRRDRTLEQAMRIESILSDVRPEEGWDDAEEVAEEAPPGDEDGGDGEASDGPGSAPAPGPGESAS
jgi:ribosome-binding factor A